MKVLHLSSLTTTTPPQKYGGTERLVHYLCEELSKLKIQTHLIRLSGSKGGDYRSTNIDNKDILKKTRAIIIKIHPDIIHLHFKHEELIDFLSSQKIPVVITLYNNIRKTSSWTKILAHHSRNITFTAISDNLKKRASQYIRNKRDKKNGVISLPPCYDLTLYKAQKNTAFPKDYFIYLGTISRYKAVLEVAKAFVGSSENLLIVGPCTDPKELNYFAEVLSYTKYKNIQYHGETRSDMEKIDLLSKAKGLILATGFSVQEKDCYEAFGLVMLEANALGIPIIGYKQGNIEDYVLKNKNGILFSNVAQLQKALKQIQTKDWSRSCRVITENYDSRNIAKQYAALYRKIISDTRA